MWSGRFSRQKNIELLIAIAKAAPEVMFDVYGSGETIYGDRLRELARHSNNVVLKGGYDSTAALPTYRYAAYVFTSLWEGIPTTIIDMAARGIPLVATDVGGISELLSEDTGWLVESKEDPQEYSTCVESDLAESAEALRRTSTHGGVRKN